MGRTGTFITIDTLLHRLRRARDAERLDSAEEPCDSVGVDPLSSRALGPLDVAGTLACLRLSRSRLITDLVRASPSSSSGLSAAHESRRDVAHTEAVMASGHVLHGERRGG